MGHITAASTHEFNNVLAVIKESSELMGDILSLTAGDFAHRQRFEQALESIRTQIKRGSRLCRHLNAFAHSADLPLTEIEVTDTLKRLAALCQRFARNREVSIQVEDAAKPLALLTRPVRFQMALFCGFELFWQLLPGRNMHLEWEEGDKTVTIFLKAPPKQPDSPAAPNRPEEADARKQDLQLIMESLEGKAQIAEHGSIVLQFPRRLPSADH